MYTPLRMSDETSEKVDKDLVSVNVTEWHPKRVLFLIIASTLIAGTLGFALGYHSWELSRGTKDGHCPFYTRLMSAIH